LEFYIILNHFPIYNSYSRDEISDCPESSTSSPVIGFEIVTMILVFPDNTRGSSFESFYDIGYWFVEWSSQIQMNMVFFHTHSDDGNVEFFADSFYYLFDGTLEFT
jgi:hypothetical protein